MKRCLQIELSEVEVEGWGKGGGDKGGRGTAGQGKGGQSEL